MRCFVLCFAFLPTSFRSGVCTRMRTCVCVFYVLSFTFLACSSISVKSTSLIISFFFSLGGLGSGSLLGV